MKNIYLAYFLIIMLSACGGKSSDTVSLSGEIKGLGNDTLYIYGADEMYDRMDTLPVENGQILENTLSGYLGSCMAVVQRRQPIPFLHG